MILRKTNIVFSLFLFSTFCEGADYCPSPRSGVDPIVKTSVSFDKKTMLYRYRYSLKNGGNGRLPLDFFGLYITETPSSSRSPAHWIGTFTDLSFAPSDFTWLTHAPKDSEANKISDSVTLSDPAYALKPGQSAEGFEIISPQPPGVVQFYAEGFTQPAVSTPTEKNDEPVPQCETSNFKNPKIQNQVTGMTTGPSDPAIQSVRIRAREEKGEGRCSTIYPKKPSGKIAILVLSTRSFDASQIDVSSVIFGPGYAPAIASRPTPSGKGEKIDEDEQMEWERSSEDFRAGEADRKNVHSKNLLLTFNVADLDVQCNLDRALFLRGKTTAGQLFVGAVPAKTAGCGLQESGIHRRHPYPFKWWKPQKGRKG